MTREIDGAVFRNRLEESMGGMTSSQLGKRIGVSATQVYHWLKGDCLPNLYSAYLIAYELGISLDWLSGLEDDE